MDWLRSEDLKEEKVVTTPIIIIALDGPIACCCQAHRRVKPLGKSKLHQECPASDSCDRLVAADVQLRQEPDEDEEEDEGDGKKNEDDDDTNDGYSE
jgi:hypothetical protein